jgi:hypothetical protein
VAICNLCHIFVNLIRVQIKHRQEKMRHLDSTWCQTCVYSWVSTIFLVVCSLFFCYPTPPFYCEDLFHLRSNLSKFSFSTSTFFLATIVCDWQLSFALVLKFKFSIQHVAITIGVGRSLPNPAVSYRLRKSGQQLVVANTFHLQCLLMLRTWGRSEFHHLPSLLNCRIFDETY